MQTPQTLYGLKQSPRQRNRKIDEFFVHLGFIRLEADHSIYHRRSRPKGELAIIIIYVDDLIILTSSPSTMSVLKSELQMRFAMTDCGEIHHFLGLRVTRDRSGRQIFLGQSRFAEEILAKFGMTNCKPVSTPLDSSVHLKRPDDGC